MPVAAERSAGRLGTVVARASPIMARVTSLMVAPTAVPSSLVAEPEQGVDHHEVLGPVHVQPRGVGIGHGLPLHDDAPPSRSRDALCPNRTSRRKQNLTGLGGSAPN